MTSDEEDKNINRIITSHASFPPINIAPIFLLMGKNVDVLDDFYNRMT